MYKDTRVCAWCRADISYRRIDAKYCSKRCAQRSRSNLNGESEKAKRHAYYVAHKEQAAKWAKTRYEQNKEQIKSRVRAHYHRTKNDRIEQRRNYRISNKSHKADYDRGYRQANVGALRIEKLAWKRTHAEELRQKKRADYRSFPEKYAVWNEQRRAAKLGNPHSVGVSRRDWLRLLRRYDFRCAYCSTKSSILHMEHIMPLSRGGRHAIGNVLPACAPCNLSKGTSFLAQWRIRKAYVHDCIELSRRDGDRARPAARAPTS